MGLNLLKKGDKQQLDSGLTKIRFGLGWKSDADLDSSCLMLGKNDRVRSNADFIYYHQKESPCGSIFHWGDKLESDDSSVDAEKIDVDLTKVPDDIVKLLFVVTIYNAKGLNFGQVDDAYIRLVDLTTDEEILRLELSEDAQNEESVLFGELVKTNGVWEFHALSKSVKGGLRAIITQRGVTVKA